MTWKISINVDIDAGYGRWRLGSGGELVVGRAPVPAELVPADAA